MPLDLFQGQSDISAAVIPGSATFDESTKQYIINSAGYNVWYSRDEFRYLWKKMSGDISLAADVAFPDRNGYKRPEGDLYHSPEPRRRLERGYGRRARHWNDSLGAASKPRGSHYRYAVPVRRLACENVSEADRHREARRFDRDFSSAWRANRCTSLAPLKLHLEGPFYAGIGFCSHLPDKSDTAVLLNVILRTRHGGPVGSCLERKSIHPPTGRAFDCGSECCEYSEEGGPGRTALSRPSLPTSLFWLKREVLIEYAGFIGTAPQVCRNFFVASDGV